MPRRRTHRARRTRLSDRLRPDLAVWDDEPIADLLDGLPFNQRAVVVLRFYVGLNNVEIADALDSPPGSVGPWITRALEHLETCELVPDPHPFALMQDEHEDDYRSDHRHTGPTVTRDDPDPDLAVADTSVADPHGQILDAVRREQHSDRRETD